jgi:hypothetical protein
MINKNRIDYINKRLLDLVEEAKTASETMKIFLRQTYKLLSDEKKRILLKEKHFDN